jgi:serine/threonine-protein kinase
MSDAPGKGPALLIDRACDRFEADWRAGRRPAIEQYVDALPEALRPRLLRELLALEVECRARAGERPAADEYRRRFPGHAALIDEAFRRPLPAAGEATLTLTVTEGPHAGRTFSLTGHDTFLVGRSKQAHFRLPTKDRYFSRVHFMVEVNPPRCRLTDVGSHNGTLVNGRRVMTAELHDGDLIKAGHTVLRVSLPEARPAAEPPTITLATAPPASAPVAPPTGPEFPVIAGYDLVRELGRGGMGVVYLAVRQADGARVAVKTIVPAVAASRTQVERFLREARILCQLEHPHVVAYRDMGESNGRLFFAMDYVEGTDAGRLLRADGPLSPRAAVRLTCQLLEALEYAHEKGFVHRDIKPGNVLVAREGDRRAVKLADFGLARAYQASQLSGLTLQGEVGGTVAFMPPEQITHFRQVKPPADQYSAAATLYNLLTGKFVYDFTDHSALALGMILLDDPVPILDRRPDLPAGLAEVIHRALSRAPEDRFADVRAFRRALVPFGR